MIACERTGFTNGGRRAMRAATVFLSLGLLAAWPGTAGAQDSGAQDSGAQDGVAQDTGRQDPERGVPVAERKRPEVDPQGIRAGGFLIFPRLGLSEAYSDNIYATENNEEGDFITVFEPSVSARSDWNRHALNLSARTAIGRYLDNGDEDYEDYFLNADGRVDVTRQSAATGRLGYSRRHEDRSDPDEVNGVEPTEYTLATAGAAFRQAFNRLAVTLGGEYSRYDYDDVRSGTGAIINNDDRDYDETVVSLRTGYRFRPDYEAFVRGAYNMRDYDDAVDDAGFNRDSDGYEAVAGLSVDFSGVTSGEVFAGYRAQDYDDQRLEDFSGPTMGAGINWNPTLLTSLRFDVTRSVEETTATNASGYVASRFAVKVDHELLRNLLVGGDAAYTLNDYEGIDREDDNYAAGIYGKYMMNRYAHARLSYDHRRRDSSVSAADFAENIVRISLDLQL